VLTIAAIAASDPDGGQHHQPALRIEQCLTELSGDQGNAGHRLALNRPQTGRTADRGLSLSAMGCARF
jgi:hypothetical protein